MLDYNTIFFVECQDRNGFLFHFVNFTQTLAIFYSRLTSTNIPFLRFSCFLVDKLYNSSRMEIALAFSATTSSSNCAVFGAGRAFCFLCCAKAARRQSTRFFALFHVKTFKNNLKRFCYNDTIILSFYGKIGVCPVRTGRERGGSCGVVRITMSRQRCTPLVLCSTALRKCEEGIIV